MVRNDWQSRGPAMAAALGVVRTESSRKGNGVDIAECVVLVTGGASGLGPAAVKKFLGAGAQVVIVDLPFPPGADSAAELGRRVIFKATDVTSEAQVTAAMDAGRELGTLRVAVNCAG
ncbi:SDR family NAD(P)-dependent oxidoreductase [Streptomyces phaeochromogenes]